MIGLSMLAALGEISTSQWAMIAAIIIATFVVLNIRRRRRPLDGSPRQYRREIESAARDEEGLRTDLGQLMIQLEELARRINGQIDTKFAKLEQSIADADKRIAALRVLIEASKPAARDPSADASDPATRTGDGPTADGRASDGPDASWLERHGAVYELADAGQSPEEIARQLGRRIGEVELILNLRVKSPTGASSSDHSADGTE